MPSRTALHGFAALVHPTPAIASITCNSQPSRILERWKDFTESDESRRFWILLPIHRLTRRSLNSVCDQVIAVIVAKSSPKPFKTNLAYKLAECTREIQRGKIDWTFEYFQVWTLFDFLLRGSRDRTWIVCSPEQRCEESKIPGNWSG